MASKCPGIDIYNAAENGDWAKIKRLYVDGMDLDWTCGWDYPFEYSTVLSKAAGHGQWKCVQTLVGMGACAKNESMMEYKYALELAAVKGHLKCFRFLVENRLFKAVDDIQKYQVFIDASRRRDFDQIQKLLMENIDSGILNGWKGNNLMSLFVVYGCPPYCLQLLIDQGVDVNGVDYNGFTPLMCAVLTENVNCVRFLLGRGVNVNAVDINDTEGNYFQNDGGKTMFDNVRNHSGATALMYSACLSSNESLCEILQYCSDNGLDVDCENGKDYYWTALDYAVYYGNRDSVSLLIKSGARLIRCKGFSSGFGSVNYSNHYHAMLHHRPDILKLILKTDEDLLLVLSERHNFCHWIDINCLAVLLKCIKTTIKDWMTHACDLLMTAVEFNRLDCVSRLLDQGVDINHRFCGKTTLLMRLLDCEEADKLWETFNLLMERGADIHLKDSSGRTAIMHAAGGKTVYYIKKLVSQGADIHDRDEEQNTTLMFACRQHRVEVEVVDFFIKHGVDVNAQNKYGRTAMMSASCCVDKCVKLLLDEGADLDLTDKAGGTVFSIAMCDNGSCVDVLLHSGKLLCDGVLKPEHKQAVCEENRKNFDVKSLMSTMKFGIFEWAWACSSKSSVSIAGAAVMSGISPGNFKYKTGAEVTPFQLAFIKLEVPVMMYYLANRYLFPEDLRVLYTCNPHVVECPQDWHDKFSSLIDKFNTEPLRLQTLSFLTISKAVSLAGSPSERFRLLHTLPLPEKFKTTLRFETDVAKLCPIYWGQIEIERVFDNLNFREEFSLDCKKKCRLYCDQNCHWQWRA